MLRVFIVEDELSGQEVLRDALHAHCPEVMVVGVASNVPDAIQGIEQLKPNLIFLDVELQEQTGFDLLQHFPHPSFKVIFYTAHGHYAIDAFKFATLDYLLKPLNVLDGLLPAIQKANNELLKTQSEQDNQQYLAQMKAQIEVMMDYFHKPGNSRNKIAIPTSFGIEMIQVDDIIRCEAAKDYTIFYTIHKRSIISSYGIGNYENSLKVYDFFRSHNSHIINFKHIIRFVKQGEQGEILMSDEVIIPVSKRNRNLFVEWLNNQRH